MVLPNKARQFFAESVIIGLWIWLDSCLSDRGYIRSPNSLSVLADVSSNPLSWQGNVDYRKIALDYATLGRAFRKKIFPETFYRVFINKMIVKTISLWKPLSREFT